MNDEPALIETKLSPPQVSSHRLRVPRLPSVGRYALAQPDPGAVPAEDIHETQADDLSLDLDETGIFITVSGRTHIPPQIKSLYVHTETGSAWFAQLFLSEATAKWHLHNIYAKPGVNNRTGAIARARQLSLL